MFLRKPRKHSLFRYKLFCKERWKVLQYFFKDVEKWAHKWMWKCSSQKNSQKNKRGRGSPTRKRTSEKFFFSDKRVQPCFQSLTIYHGRGGWTLKNQATLQRRLVIVLVKSVRKNNWTISHYLRFALTGLEHDWLVSPKRIFCLFRSSPSL